MPIWSNNDTVSSKFIVIGLPAVITSGRVTATNKANPVPVGVYRLILVHVDEPDACAGLVFVRVVFDVNLYDVAAQLGTVGQFFKVVTLETHCDNLVDGVGIRVDGTAAGFTADAAEPFAVFSEIQITNGDVFFLDVLPDIDFTPA